ncbi:helix-turn-helix domain-containing protein [Paenibacillus paeoniae]|uniref:Helix-turn-helix domain-containing protein n=1 Tax=Paenibacillus paeoniae TaxID=2292705 RepID=A0A371PGH3_9BACL|nr:helix-turn-helix domain-containing protein [Paenibacillus paeoniae]REK75049.1 helix-turn-helix domain-containing protein [Paenibacillus paeoniae]
MSLQQFNLLTLHEAMDLLGISRSTFDRWRRQKQLPFRKIGKEIWIDKTELELWIHRHATILHNAALLKESVRNMSSGQQPFPESETVSHGRHGAYDEPPLVVEVGFQSRSAQIWTSLIMKELGWFEEELSHTMPGKAIQVQWTDAPNGPELVQGMIGGRIHIASLGDYPIALCSSLGQVLPSFRPVLLACDGKTGAGQGIALVIRNGIQLKTASHFESLTISAVAQSSSGGRMANILQAFGIEDSQVLHKELDDSIVSMMRGEISGSVLNEPYISLARHHGLGRVLVQEEQGDDFLTGIVVDEDWANRHPAVIVAYLKAHIRVHQYVRTYPIQAAGIISRLQGIPAEVAASIVSSVRWDSTLYEKELHSLNRLNQEQSRNNGWLTAGHGIQYRFEYLYEAMEALRLPVPGSALLHEDWAARSLY